MGTVIKAGLLGGIILFIWSAVSWMVLPWHEMTIHHFKNEKAISEVIKANADVSGMYISPNMCQDSVAKGKEVIEGPIVFAAVHLENTPSSMTIPMLISFLTQVIAAVFVAWLLLKTKGLSYAGRVGFVVVFALAAAIVTDIPYWNWFGVDCHYTLVTMADLLIGWFFAGLVMAKICRNQ